MDCQRGEKNEALQRWYAEQSKNIVGINLSEENPKQGEDSPLVAGLVDLHQRLNDICSPN